MPCLDTDFLVGCLRADASALAQMDTYCRTKEPLTTTIISVCELMEGAHKSRNVVLAIAQVRTLLEPLDILDFSVAAAERFGLLSASLKRGGQMLEDFDLLIAAIALENGQNLVTRNRKHFERVPGLEVKTW